MEEFELEPGEEVVTNVRTHPFVLIIRLLPFIFLAFVPWLASGFLSFFASASPEAAGAFTGFNLPAHLGRFLYGFWYLCLWTGTFSTFTRYYLNVWVITNLRIVDIKQYSFFNREVSSFLLARVQDVTTDISGLPATLFGFGKLSVETAGKDEDFHMEGLADPTRIRDIIMSQVAQIHRSDPTVAGV